MAEQIKKEPLMAYIFNRMEFFLDETQILNERLETKINNVIGPVVTIDKNCETPPKSNETTLKSPPNARTSLLQMQNKLEELIMHNKFLLDRLDEII